MRDIGQGQTVKILVTAKVRELISKVVHVPPEESVTVSHICCWLMYNSLQSERIQYMQLCEQNITHVWRKQAFDSLMGSEAVGPPSGINKPLFQVNCAVLIIDRLVPFRSSSDVTRND